MAPGGKLPDIFLRERYEKAIKYIQVYDVYTPNYHKTTITPKFYSKYEGDIDEFDAEVLETMNRAKDWGPRERQEWPETTSQAYGWWPRTLVDLDRNDPRFYFPKVGSEITKVGLELLRTKPKEKKK